MWSIVLFSYTETWKEINCLAVSFNSNGKQSFWIGLWQGVWGTYWVEIAGCYPLMNKHGD